MKLPKNLYSRLSLVTSVTLVIGYFIVYAATTYYPNLPNVGTGSGLTATSWNDLVNYANKAVKQESEVITVTGGTVGIGTVSPKEVLDVRGNISTVGGYMQNLYWDGAWKSTMAGYGSYWSFDKTIGMQYFWNSPTSVGANTTQTLNARMVIDKTGNIGIGTMSPNSHLTINNTSNLDPLEAQVDGTPYFKVKMNGNSYFGGNVGIGTPSPGQKLEVNGFIKLSPSFYNNAGLTDNIACSAGQEGSILYNAANGNFYGCNGVSMKWRQLNL